MPDSPLYDERGTRLSTRRLAENEQLFQSINRKLDDLSREMAEEDGEPPPEVVSFFCECSNTACRLRIPMAVERYRAAHSTPERFTIALGHEVLSVERVVQRFDSEGYEVIEKLEEAPGRP